MVHLSLSCGVEAGAESPDQRWADRSLAVKHSCAGCEALAARTPFSPYSRDNVPVGCVVWALPEAQREPQRQKK